MQIFYRFNTRKFISISLAFLFIILIFQKNIFNSASNEFFNDFQRDSESLVIGRIVAEEMGIEKNGSQLGFIGKNGEFKYPDNIYDSYELFHNFNDFKNAIYAPYHSQVGFQGWVYSKIQNLMNFEKISKLQYFTSALLSAIILWMYFIYKKIYGDMFSLIFISTLVTSPWIVAFARNLYWSPFLWFAPALFASLLYLSTNKIARLTLYFFIFLAFFAKCLSGYEYITTITLFTCSVFIIAPIFKNRDSNPDWKTAFIVFLLCIIGFTSAILVHAKNKGGTVAEGIFQIYKEDVKRRTYGNSSDFPEAYKASLEASPVTVVKTYIVNWSTQLTLGIPGSFFKILILISMLGLFCKMQINHRTFKRDFVAFSFMLLSPLSWFILAKGHSHVHTHMNYVLWYLGFVPVLIYVSINSVVVLSFESFKFLKNLNPKNF